MFVASVPLVAVGALVLWEGRWVRRGNRSGSPAEEDTDRGTAPHCRGQALAELVGLHDWHALRVLRGQSEEDDFGSMVPRTAFARRTVSGHHTVVDPHTSAGAREVSEQEGAGTALGVVGSR